MTRTRILIVEDEAIVAEDLAGKVRRLGYGIAGIAAEGEEAISMAGRLRPNLVLMDIRLGGTMDGIEAADAIGRQYDVPVIYLTAHSDTATFARAKQTGPFGYILKPFEERDLATQIELALYKHQADRQVREQREWLRVTLTSIGDAVIATDAEGRITFINPVAESLTGWNAVEAKGIPVAEVFRLVNEQSRKPLEGPVIHVLRESRIVPLEDHSALVTKDGRNLPVEDTAAPIVDAAGQLIGVVLVFRDTTEKRCAEEQLRQTHKMEAIGRLAGGIAHEFNNLLNVIHGNAELLGFKLGKESPLTKYIREITDAAQRAANLSDQLLTYSRKPISAPDHIDLDREIEARLTMLEGLAGKSIAIRFQPGKSVWPVRIDPGQLDRILANLARNAADAISDSGSITITTANVPLDRGVAEADLPPGDYVKLSFADTGVGMSREIRERIFDPFFTTRDTGKGTGLGLSTTLGIIKQNNGGITVESEPGKGSTFHIFFPRSDVDSNLGPKSPF